MYTFDKFNKDDGGSREWTYEVVKTVFVITILKPYEWKTGTRLKTS